MDLQALKNERTLAKAAITRIVNWIKANLNENVKQFETRKDRLIIAFDKYCSAQDNIDLLEPDNTEDRDQIENNFHDALSIILDRLDSDLNTTQSSLNSPNNNFSQHNNNIKLPEIKIQPFDGKLSEFASFFELFEALISENHSLSNVQKFLYLKSFLRNEPLHLISSLPAVNDSFQVAIDLLKNRYENKLAVVNAYLSNILEIEPLKKCTAPILRKFVNDIKQNLDMLEKLNLEVEQLWELLLIYLFEKKLDPGTHKFFEMERDIDSLPTLPDFLNTLKKRCVILENLASTDSVDRKPLRKVTLHTGNSPKHSQDVQVGHQTLFCVACGTDNHSIYHCETFKCLNPSDRQKIVRDKRLCFNCLGSKHSLKQCVSNGKCHICSRKHHTLLHCPQPHTSNLNLQSSQFNKNSRNVRNNKSQLESQPQQSTLENHSDTENRTYENPIQHSNSHSHETSHVNTNSVYRPRNTQQQPSTSTRTEDNTTPTTSVTMSSLSGNKSYVLLATALVTVFDIDGNPIPCRVLLDCASQNNFVTEKFVQKLRISPYSKSINISGISQSAFNCTKMIDLTLHSNVCTDIKFKLPCILLSRITSKLPQVKLTKDNLPIPPHCQLSDPQFHFPSDIDLLIGAEVYYQIILNETFSLGKNLPTLQNTKFGWIIAGTVPKSACSNNNSFIFNNPSYASIDNENNNVSMLVNSSEPIPTNLDNLVEKFWSLEEVPQTKIIKPEDELSEDIFIKTTQILDSGRYQVDLPLKMDPQNLGDSFQIAKKRFENLEKRFSRDPNYFDQYKKFINEYISLDHGRLIPLKLFNTETQSSKYFLPHHAVIRESSTTTKLRVVFDGSCKSSSKLSLNDITHKGYQVQPDLYDIICRFRCFRYVLTADIQKMYRQIKVNPKQTFLLNILWRNDSKLPLQCIELNTVTYGTNCAPFLATRVLNDIAEKHFFEFPLASQVLTKQCYVDDILGGVKNENELEALFHQLNNVLNPHGFTLHKWCSNSLLIRNFVKEENISDLNIDFEHSPNKVLGLKWNPTEDYLSITIPKVPKFDKTTKRKILSCIAQCYDPLGLLAPVIVVGKLIMQKLWLFKLDWDKEITDSSLLTEWTEFISNISTLTNLKIPRYLFLHYEITRIEFHGFADASIKAYAACVYLRVIYTNGQISSNLVSSKSRVAPLKVVSLPRLELCAMLLLSKLITKLIAIFKDHINPKFVVLWTDSQIALHWIASHSSKWNTFVANRVSQIQSITSEFIWRHIDSSDNPADLPSRGLLAQNIIDCPLWWHGPPFLQNSNSEFSLFESGFEIEEVPEAKKVTLINTNSLLEIQFWDEIFSRFSKFKSLQRTIAYVLRFKNNSIRSNQALTGPLSINELANSLSLIVRALQNQYFSKEKFELANKKVISDKNLQGLNLFLDEAKLIRVGGRLKNADISFEQKHPILLPSHNRIVSLMLYQEHVRLGHAGAQTVLSNFRLKFWPINGLRQAKNAIRKCLICFRFRAQPTHQIMADIPKQRLTLSRPFSITGIDYGGPFFVKFSQSRKASLSKAYMAIFVCMSTKAVHIELVSELSTNCFIQTLNRFISRRGNPSQIFCDNATNFVGADNQLNELAKFFQSQKNSDTIKNYLSQNEIEFRFIPPRSPHWGGLWESSIKSAKYHIKRLVGKANLTFEELYTTLTRIEAILNSRPLCALSNDPNDLQALTPGHFLIGTSLTAYPEKDITNVNENRLTRWMRCSQMQQTFWKRWSVEYLNRLQNRPKWTKPISNLKVNDLVLIKEPDTPPLLWPLARVIDTYPGKDSRVRVVKLKTQNGTLTRNITRLCPLPYCDNEN